MMTLIGLALDVAIVLAIVLTLVAFVVAIAICIPIFFGAGIWTICDKVWHRNDEEKMNFEEDNNDND